MVLILSLLTLSSYQSLFVSKIMLGYFSLSSNNLCICNLIHVIYLLVSSNSPPPSLFYVLILCVLYRKWTTSSLLFSSSFLGVHTNITPWVFVQSLWFCHWILRPENSLRHNTHCPPTMHWPQMMLWKAPEPTWIHTGTLSQAISTQKVKKSTVFVQVLWSVPSVKNLIFTMWCSW